MSVSSDGSRSRSAPALSGPADSLSSVLPCPPGFPRAASVSLRSRKRNSGKAAWDRASWGIALGDRRLCSYREAVTDAVD